MHCTARQTKHHEHSRFFIKSEIARDKEGKKENWVFTGKGTKMQVKDRRVKCNKYCAKQVM